MDLDSKSTKDLLELHNSLAAVPAGPKTFSTKAKLIARIRSLSTSGAVECPRVIPSITSADVRSAAPADDGRRSVEAASVPTAQKQRGLGVGVLARTLLMDPAGYPYVLVAAMVNEQIPGAAATDKSVRWYASKMRKAGVVVPPRAQHFPAFMDEKQSKAWLKTVSLVGPASK